MIYSQNASEKGEGATREPAEGREIPPYFISSTSPLKLSQLGSYGL
jgi:hypothetical protein